MNYLNFDGEFNFDNFDEFIKELKECNQEEDIILFLTTPGGEHAVYKYMLEALKGYPKHIYVVTEFECSSAGFCFLSEIVNDDKFTLKLGNSTFSIVHLASVDYSISEVRKGTDKAKFWTSRMDSINKIGIERYKQMGFTEKELQLILDGEDLYLNAQDLRRVLKLEAE